MGCPVEYSVRQSFHGLGCEQPVSALMQGRGPEEGVGCRKSKSKRGSLGCWTSAIEADIYRTGELVSKRMDVLVSRDFSVSKG